MRQVPWHTLPIGDTLARWSVTEKGLSDGEAAERLDRYGRNRLPERRRATLIGVFFHQFASPLIYILIAAGTASISIGETTDAAFIFGIIIFNAFIGTLQEWKAEQSAASLQKMIHGQAGVRREDREKRIPTEEVAPGEVVLLESGDRVPADLRLLQATGLTINEAALTGESQGAEKRTEPRETADLPLGDRLNMAFAGTTVTQGRGAGVVVATGMKTQIGEIAREIGFSRAEKTPLVRRMETFTNQISIVILVICLAMGITAYLKGMPGQEVFFLAVALAVSAIPEGLPIVMTVTLSIGMQRMAQRHVIVRKMNAMEGLGSCTVIASDKTGTMTLNIQTVRVVSLPAQDSSWRRYRITGEGYVGEGEVRAEQQEGEEPKEALKVLARAGILCNEASLWKSGDEWEYEGDPLDIALLSLGYKCGLSPEEVRQNVEMAGEIPYESARRYAAKFYRNEGQGSVRVAVKGAVETLLSFCDVEEEHLLAELDRLSSEGYRVIAVAEGDVAGDFWQGDEKHLRALRLLGLVGLMDPLRPEVRGAVVKCRQAGVHVAMITGDHPTTAVSIARQLEIIKPDEGEAQAVMTGMDLDRLAREKNGGLDERIGSIRVFARVAPLQKVQIVESFKRSGHFVTVTGDGVNDAPALHKAHISVAMGSGTDLAKDVSSIIIADDNFASLVAGMEQGRFAYDNVRKVIYFLISSAIAEVFLVTLSILFGLPIPLVAVQLLWLNLVTNGIQDIALAFEAGEEGALKRPPRPPDEGIFNRLMLAETFYSGLIMGLVTLGLWYWLLQAGYSEASARNLVLLLMVFLENFHVFNCRSETTSAFKIPISRNVVLVLGVIAAQAVHIGSMFIPFMKSVLGTEPVALTEWLTLLGLGSIILVAVEVFKWTIARRMART